MTIASIFPSKKDEFPPFKQATEWPLEAIREKNWTKAAQRWAVLRQNYPEHPEPWLQGAKALIETEQLDQADNLLAYGRQHFPDNPNSLIISAELAMKQQKWSDAEAFLLQARNRFPDNLLTWMKSANLSEQQGEQEQAEAYNKRARQCNPNLPAPFIQFAELAMRAKQWQSALIRWEQLRKSFPDIPAGYLRAAEAMRQLNRPKEAQKLTLEHQYGTDIFDKTHQISPKKKHSNDKSNLSNLLDLIWIKAIFNLRSEIHRNYLSYSWWLLEPLLHMVIYYIVFALLLNRGGENYLVFLLTGLIPWMWFMKSVGGSSGSILSGQNLMLQIGLPSIIFPLISLLQTSLKQLPVFAVLIGFVWLQGYSPSNYWWAIIPVMLVQILLTTAFACLVAAVIPFIRDLSYLVPTGLTLLMFMSGIFYDYKMISPELQDLFLMNPIAFLLKSYREIFIDNMLPDMMPLLWWGLGSLISCFLILLAYNRLRYIFPRIVLE